MATARTVLRRTSSAARGSSYIYPHPKSGCARASNSSVRIRSS